jgi:hypothetical protein
MNNPFCGFRHSGLPSLAFDPGFVALDEKLPHLETGNSIRNCYRQGVLKGVLT